jgi:hypothetical protein
MTQPVLQLALAALLIATSDLSARRWGERVAGVTSALPAIAGPFLLLVADEHGGGAAATAANGTLGGGLVILGGFVVAYARAARGHVWFVSLGAGWIVATALAALVELLEPRAPLGVLLAVSSLLLAQRLMPPGELRSRRAASGTGLLLLMAIAALLVFVLAHAVGIFGPQIGGALAGLPVIATILAVDAHRRRGAEASTGLMRGMLEGMAGFVVFCETVALTFSVATVAALTVQGAVVCLASRQSTRSLARPRRA